MNEDTDSSIENPEDGAEERLQSVNEMRTLYNLHHDIWDEGLLEPPFLFYYQRVLHPRERQIVDGRVRGMTDSELAESMGIEVMTVSRSIYNIRYVFRNKCRPRVNKFWSANGLYRKRRNRRESKNPAA